MQKIRNLLVGYKMTQVQLAKRLKVDPSRINEIVKYCIDLHMVDKLLDLAEKLQLDFEVEVTYFLPTVSA